VARRYLSERFRAAQRTRLPVSFGAEGVPELDVRCSWVPFPSESDAKCSDTHGLSHPARDARACADEAERAENRSR
jgi:hypothetical protein